MCHDIILDEYRKWLENEIDDESNNTGGWNFKGVLLYAKTHLDDLERLYKQEKGNEDPN